MVDKTFGKAGLVNGYGEEGWCCLGCQVSQPNGVPVYYITPPAGAEPNVMDSYRCEDCCRKMGLLW